MSSPRSAIDQKFRAHRALLATASLVVIIAGLRAAESILVPLLFAVFLGILGSAPLMWLQRRGVPKPLSVLSVALSIIAVFAMVGALLGNSLNTFTSELPQYRSRLEALLPSLTDYLAAYGVELSLTQSLEGFGVGQFLDLFGRTVRGVASALSSTLFVFICMTFILVEAAEIRGKITQVLHTSVDLTRIRGIGGDVQKYLIIKTFTSMLTGIAVGGWVWVMGGEFALLWGLVAFLFNYVPIVGSIIASIPAILLSLVSFGVPHALALAVGYIVINVGISNFFEPILMGRRLGLSPLVILLSLLFWGWIWGPAGMLLSVPLTMILKIALEYTSDLQWVAKLMEAGSGSEAHCAQR